MKESLQFLTKYLATFSSEDAQVLDEVKEEAVRAVIEFVKASSIFQVRMCKIRLSCPDTVLIYFIGISSMIILNLAV